MDEITLTPHQKIGLVKYQIEDLRSGKITLLVCPYCGGQNYAPKDGDPADPMCCDTLNLCLGAIFQDEDIARSMETAKRIADRVVQSQRPYIIH